MAHLHPTDSMCSFARLARWETLRRDDSNKEGKCWSGRRPQAAWALKNCMEPLEGFR